MTTIERHDAKPRLAVVVGPGSATIRDILHYGAAIADLVLVFDATNAHDAWVSRLRQVLQDEVECVVFCTGAPEELLDLHDRAPLTAITTFAETNIRLTAEIAVLLNLPYHSPECAMTLTDKSAQRAALARAGLGIRFGVADTPEHAAELVRRLGVDCVVKPLTGSGSRHTYSVNPKDALSVRNHPAEMYPAIVEARLEDGRHPRSELLADLVSVETIFTGGRLRHLGVSGRFRLAEPFRETGTVFPSHLPEPLLAELTEVTTRALSAIGVTTGATHTELKLTPGGPQLIEVNGRLGGHVGRLMELSTGINAVELVIRTACGLPISVPSETAVTGVAMLVPPVEATRLDSPVPTRQLQAVDGVVAVDVHTQPGTPVDYRMGWQAHIACVWYRTADWSTLSTAHTAVLEVADQAIKWG